MPVGLQPCTLLSETKLTKQHCLSCCVTRMPACCRCARLCSHYFTLTCTLSASLRASSSPAACVNGTCSTCNQNCSVHKQAKDCKTPQGRCCCPVHSLLQASTQYRRNSHVVVPQEAMLTQFPSPFPLLPSHLPHALPSPFTPLRIAHSALLSVLPLTMHCKHIAPCTTVQMHTSCFA